MRTALITGAAGFIGSHLVDRLLAEDWRVLAVDNFDPFYDSFIKERNLAHHASNRRFTLIRADVRDFSALRELISDKLPEVIVHLAAKAGVRPSIDDPLGYYDVNVRGTQNLLELAKDFSVRQFVFASSSSVYGINPSVPWSEDDHVLLPISPYASTKVSGELMGHVYSHLYGIRFIALRLFTVYGPRQRPDLAIHRFGTLLQGGKPLPLFGSGFSRRSYTFIGDVVNGICAAMDYSGSVYETVNIANNHTTSLTELITVLEEVSGLHASVNYLLNQPGDVPVTSANLRKARMILGYQAQTDIRTGLRVFWRWLTENSG